MCLKKKHVTWIHGWNVHLEVVYTSPWPPTWMTCQFCSHQKSLEAPQRCCGCCLFQLHWKIVVMATNHPRSGHLKSMDPTSHSSGWLVDKRTLRKSTSSGSFGDFLVGVNEPGLIASWKNVNPSNVDSIPWFIIIFLNFSVATLEVSPPVLWEICRYPHR